MAVLASQPARIRASSLSEIVGDSCGGVAGSERFAKARISLVIRDVTQRAATSLQKRTQPILRCRYGRRFARHSCRAHCLVDFSLLRQPSHVSLFGMLSDSMIPRSSNRSEACCPMIYFSSATSLRIVLKSCPIYLLPVNHHSAELSAHRLPTVPFPSTRSRI
jgi:hypothetical protein